MPRKQHTQLAKMSRSELKALADQALELVRSKETEFIESIKEQARELGIEISELVSTLTTQAARVGRQAAAAVGVKSTRGGKRSSRMKGKKIKPWFSLDGKTWSGRGIEARFIKEFVVGGGKLLDILVDKTKVEEAKRIEANILKKHGSARGAAAKSTAKKARGK